MIIYSTRILWVIYKFLTGEKRRLNIEKIIENVNQRCHGRSYDHDKRNSTEYGAVWNNGACSGRNCCTGGGQVLHSGFPHGTNEDGSYADGIITVSTNTVTYNGGQHGIQVGDGTVFTVAVAGNAKITLYNCKYGNSADATLTVTDANGNSVYSGTAYGAPSSDSTDDGSVSFDYTGDATTLTMVYSGSGYVHQIVAKNESAVAVVAEAGKTYTADFRKGLQDSYADGIFTVEGDVKYNGASHGIQVGNGTVFNVVVAGNAKITLYNCIYGNSKDATLTVTDAKGNAVYSGTAYGAPSTDSGDDGSVSFDYTGDATTLKIVYNGSGYVHQLVAENANAPVGEAVSFEFWLDSIASDVDGIMTIDPGEVKLDGIGDSKITLIGQGANKFTPTNTNYQNIQRAGKTVNAYRAGARYGNTFDAIPEQGKGSAFLFQPAADGVATMYVYCNSGKAFRVHEFDEKGKFVSYVQTENGPESYTVEVKAGHYYLFAPNGSDDLGFAGLEYLVNEPITVNASYSGIEIGNTKISLVDTMTGVEAAVLTGSNTTAKLAKGHTYELKSNDAAKKALVNGSATFKATEENVSITIEEVPDTVLTGKITSDDADFDLSAITALNFTSMADSNVVFTTTDIDPEGGYKVTLKPGEYNTSVVSAAGYETKDRVSVSTDESKNVNDVYVEPLGFTGASYGPNDMNALVDAADKYVTLSGFSKHTGGHGPSAGAGATISIDVPSAAAVKVMVSYQGDFTVTGKGETVSAKTESNGSTAEATYYAPGAETITVTINGTSYVKEISITPIAENVEFTSSINVPGDYATMKEAIAAVKSMTRPAGEEGRVTINLTADIQEQVLVDVPYITIDGGADKHEINWYYGQTGKYYSVDANGYYSETLFRDRYSKTNGSGSLWGGVVIVTGDYFKANNAVFRNTFNYEVTDKEIADGAEQLNALRTKDTDVQKYEYKERSNALYTNANYIEITNCKILSSQDTLGMNGERNYVAYFKDCVIGGNVDYICGGGAMVFDNCELRWKTYSDKNNEKIGYVCPPKSYPYIFRNCTVTSDDTEKTVMGKYGRTWGANSNVTFYATETNGLIDLNGWGEMNAGDLDSAVFYEYENTNKGEAFATTSRTKKDNSVLAIAAEEPSEELVKSYTTDVVVKDVLNSWIPDSYKFFGDVNKDGVIDSEDVKAIIKTVSTIEYTGEYDEDQADYDKNGEVNIVDAIKLTDTINSLTAK